MNETEIENNSPQGAFVDILLEIAHEDKEFRAYLRGICLANLEKQKLEEQEANSKDDKGA